MKITRTKKEFEMIEAIATLECKTLEFEHILKSVRSVRCMVMMSLELEEAGNELDLKILAIQEESGLDIRKRLKHARTRKKDIANTKSDLTSELWKGGNGKGVRSED